tara:strand:- start:3080 stop:3508 length:429 start_codon:yes stop_codon:yes gene_type:complete
MSGITYTAKRALIAGHSADVSYDMDINMEIINPDDESISDVAHVALDGSTEGLFYAIQTGYTLKTVPLGDDANGDFAKMRELIQSVAGSAQFTFDPYGTIASPDAAVTVVLVPKSCQYIRTNPIRGTAQPTWQVSFRVKVHP